ncbi:hypothetical protein F2Q68_00030242 [Brassica cretica]|uniref:Calponin-homology (CH) domain-containing protein n=1 Tax=Brassica cretica TaxID=69181 RepID=A0A8S9GBN8_BRACR|nr:hypothetical protein F2Q68_00030242 [Brassica cretica]
MSGFVGVVVSDPWLQSQFTQVELRTLNSKFVSLKNSSGNIAIEDLPPLLSKFKGIRTTFKENEIREILQEQASDTSSDVDFEEFLKIYLNLQGKAAEKSGGHSSSFLKASTTTLLHTINQSEKGSFVQHINRYLGDDPFLKQFLPLDPDSNQLYELVKDGVLICYVNNVFEDVRNGWILLEVLDKVSPGSVNWKHASKPPIKMPFRKVENCNQVVKIGKELSFSLVNVAGNDIVQGNKKLILGLLWQLMRFHMLQLLKSLRSRTRGKDMTDADILSWANRKVRTMGRKSQIESFKGKSLSNGLFFLDLLWAVEPRVVNWNLVTKGETDEEKRLNATYIVSVARKLGCSVFLLPEDIVEVNQKMILILTASIMYWSLQKRSAESSDSSSSQSTTTTCTTTSTDASPAPSVTGEDEVSSLSG